MGCGTSSHANEVQGGDNERSPAPHAVPKTRPTSMAGAVADEGAVVIDNSLVAVKGLNECMEYLASAGDLLEGIDDCPALKAAVDIFESGGAILHTIANVITPPPGGQVIGAVLAIGILVLKASRNVTACRLLASKCAEIMKYLVQGALDEEPARLNARKQALKKDIETFQSLAIKIHVFVKDTTDQNWITKMGKWVDTKKLLDDFTAQLDTLVKNFQLGLAVDTHEIVASAQRDQEKRLELIQMAGGLDAMLADENAIAEFQSYCGGSEMVMIALQRETIFLARQTRSEMSQGPHDDIKNLKLRQLWAKRSKTETMKWSLFKKIFPVDVVLDEDIKVELMRELDGDNYEAFKAAVEAEPDDEEDNADNWKSLEVAELNKAFPKDGDDHLLQRVKELKEKFRDQCLSNNLGDKPVLLSSRDTEIKQVVDYLQAGKRLVLVCGGPGEGKQSVAVKAVYDWQEQYKIKGVSYTCDLITVKTKENLEACMTDALYKVVKAGPMTAKLKTRLKTLAGSDHPVLLILSHCEGLKTSNINLEKDFQEILLQLITMVPKMQIILTTTKVLKLPDLGENAPNEVKLLPFTTESAVAMLHHLIPRISTADAELISQKFSCNPQVMKVIGGLIATKEVTVETLKEELATGVASEILTDLMDAVDGDVGQDHKNLLTSLQRSLSYLEPKKVENLILLTIFPSYFNNDCVEKVLGIRKMLVPSLLKLLTENHLLHQSEDDEYVVVPLVRDYARFTKDHDVYKKVLRDTKVKFVQYCYHMVDQAFEDSITMPSKAYQTMTKRKSYIQAALAMGADPDIANQCKTEFLLLLSCLPYVNVYSAQEITQACKTLADNYSSDPISRGCCLAVGSLFYETNKESWSKSLVMAKEAKDLLKDASNAQHKLMLALALRAEGLIGRENYSFAVSIAAHQSAVELVDSIVNDVPQDKMEKIILMAELAGTMDYCGKFAEGREVAEKAVSEATTYFSSGSHPILALCLTANGYHANAQGRDAQEAGDKDKANSFFEAALGMHESALGMRHEAKLGLDEAFSLNQKALLLQELGRYEESEKSYLESLRIRKKCQPDPDTLVANTYHAIGKLSMLSGKLAAGSESDDDPSAERALMMTLDIRERALEPGDEQIIAAGKDLVQVLTDLGREDEAVAIKKKYELE